MGSGTSRWQLDETGYLNQGSIRKRVRVAIGPTATWLDVSARSGYGDKPARYATDERGLVAWQETLMRDIRRFAAQDAKTMIASTAKLGIDPAIIPIKKHQVSIVYRSMLLHFQRRRSLLSSLS